MNRRLRYYKIIVVSYFFFSVFLSYVRIMWVYTSFELRENCFFGYWNTRVPAGRLFVVSVNRNYDIIVIYIMHSRRLKILQFFIITIIIVQQFIAIPIKILRLLRQRRLQYNTYLWKITPSSNLLNFSRKRFYFIFYA